MNHLLRLRFCTIYILLSCYALSAQNSYDIEGLVLRPKSELHKDFNTSYARLVKEIENAPRFKEKKEYLRDIKSFREYFSEQIDDGDIIRDNSLYPAVRTILDEILDKNPTLHRPDLYISRTGVANAYCMIDGSVVVTMGLIRFLKNEDQIASILCHELSHKILEHSQKTIKKSLKEKNDKNNKEVVKKLKKKKYNKSETALKLLKDRLYQNAERSRIHELEADSLGFVLFSNTDYSQGEFINALLLRAKYDTLQPIVLDKSIYYQIFDKETIDFDSSWLEMEDFSIYNYHEEKEKIDEDSIRTHPSDSLRAATITQKFGTEATESTIDSAYTQLRRIARSHQVPSLIRQEQYDYAIYLCLYRIERNEDVEFHQSQLAFLFKELYKARKDYKFNRYIQNINPKEQDEDYQQLLSFLWNLSLDDLKSISENL